MRASYRCCATHAIHRTLTFIFVVREMLASASRRCLHAASHVCRVISPSRHFIFPSKLGIWNSGEFCILFLRRLHFKLNFGALQFTNVTNNSHLIHITIANSLYSMLTLSVLLRREWHPSSRFFLNTAYGLIIYDSPLVRHVGRTFHFHFKHVTTCTQFTRNWNLNGKKSELYSLLCNISQVIHSQ